MPRAMIEPWMTNWTELGAPMPSTTCSSCVRKSAPTAGGDDAADARPRATCRRARRPRSWAAGSCCPRRCPACRGSRRRGSRRRRRRGSRRRTSRPGSALTRMPAACAAAGLAPTATKRRPTTVVRISDATSTTIATNAMITVFGMPPSSSSAKRARPGVRRRRRGAARDLQDDAVQQRVHARASRRAA